MCGIVGVASSEPVNDRDWLAQGREALCHRGPDDAGEWWSADGRVGLGHRRLAILDLSPAGHQPMLDEGAEQVVVYNGEIYNFRELRTELEGCGHRFRSQSDTEVLLAAYREWGVKCLERLNGMFAFALYDEPKRQLFLARDRAGEKPLFYWMNHEELRFASELKALLADPALPRCLDAQALDCYLAFGFVPGERCILREMKKLPPAHALLFDLETGGARVWRYWDLPAVPPPDGQSVDETALVDELEFLLEDAVRRQLVADVPVGILLSGGMDSSLVTAMAIRGNARVKTFNVRFPGYGHYDETEHARLVARHFGTEHIELDAAEARPELLLSLAHQFDEPIVDSSMIPTSLLCQVVRQHCTVALGGDGGDELFGGYVRYQQLARLRRYGSWIPYIVRRAIAAVVAVALPVGVKGRNLLQTMGTDISSGVSSAAPLFDRWTRTRLFNNLGKPPLTAEQIYQEISSSNDDLIDKATRADFRLYLAEDILVKVDRASMLHSLEVRAPFLDYRIIEFAFGKVPPWFKVDTRKRKILLKRLAARVLPAGFDMERKQGFSIPLGSWLRSGSWHNFFREVLLDAEDSLFDRRYLEHLLDGQARGRSNSERLFAIVLFELWRRIYKVQL